MSMTLTQAPRQGIPPQQPQPSMQAMPQTAAYGGAMGAPMSAPVSASAAPNSVYSLGPIQAAGIDTLMADEAARDKADAQARQSDQVITGLASHVRQAWADAWVAKQNTVETRIIQNVRARRGEYDPERMAMIQAAGGSQVYAMITSLKCRSAGSWIRDVIIGQGSDKPWTLNPEEVPDIDPDTVNSIVQDATLQIKNQMMQGAPPTDEQVRELLMSMRDQAKQRIRDEAWQAAARMEDKMETQLVEGGWLQAMDQFIDDLTTFPSAILKGPIIRNKPKLKWVKENGAWTPDVQQTLVMEWARVDPFMIYPSPSAATPQEGYLIERHRLSRRELNEMIGVDGYDDGAIRMVLDEYGDRGLHDWLVNETMYTDAKGQSTTAVQNNSEGLIDALQYWGSVPGSCLIEWGMDAKEIPVPTDEYDAEVWLIGSHVIKAVLNYDPLHRRPYYKASYEEVPGAFWGNSVADLVRDVQIVCNAAMRALVNNMGIASGPQVGINIDRLPAGEDVTQLYPWKIWQYTNDPMNSPGASNPLQFWQPESCIEELNMVFQTFSQLADDYSGVPRYMAGEAPAGGIGRTASGVSMMMGNAGKAVKQVINNIDINVTQPLLDRLYYYNMRYGTDDDLKGDVSLVARGTSALIAKDAAQVRRNEFLQATANPTDMQIVGVEGRAAILREVAKGLDMDTDKVVPPLDVLRARMAAAHQPPPPAVKAQQMIDAVQHAEVQAIAKGKLPPPPNTPPLIPPVPPPAQLAPTGPRPMSGMSRMPQQGIPTGGEAVPGPMNAQMLANQAPITDNFSPQKRA
jgi:hypothetical protein